MRNYVIFFYFFGMTSLSYSREYPQVEAARKICREKKGILVTQGSVLACFDPSRTPINDYYSPASGHPKPDKEDFDLLTQKNIRFYRHFREFSNLTVCNYTQKEIFTDFSSSMDIFGEDGLNPKKRLEKMRMQPFDCKTSGTHMFALFADSKTAEMAVGLCITPTGKPYYNQYISPQDETKSFQRETNQFRKTNSAR